MSPLRNRVPQIICTLGPNGQLVAELPGHSGSRRQLELRLNGAGQSLLRMLQAQASGQSEHSVGLEASPTRAQAQHWERHGEHPSRTCQFCIIEGLVSPESRKSANRREVIKCSDGVEVRFLQPSGANAVAKPLAKPAEEYGL